MKPGMKRQTTEQLFLAYQLDLAARFGESQAKIPITETKQAYDQFLSQMPDIGGDRSPFQNNYWKP